MRNKYAGSSFDEFLKEEGIEAEVVARAAKRTFTHQLRSKMKQNDKKKVAFRKALNSPSTAERLFDDHVGIALSTMAKAADLVNCDLEIRLVERRRKRAARRKK